MESDFYALARASVCHDIVDKAVAMFRERNGITVFAPKTELTDSPPRNIRKNIGNQNGRRRKRLWEAQSGKCFYCERALSTRRGTELWPIIEHYYPRHSGWIGEKLKIVLACSFCDKQKGGLPGPEFHTIVRECIEDFSTWEKAAPQIAARAKIRNRNILREFHVARVIGASLTRLRLA